MPCLFPKALVPSFKGKLPPFTKGKLVPFFKGKSVPFTKGKSVPFFKVERLASSFWLHYPETNSAVAQWRFVFARAKK